MKNKYVIVAEHYQGILPAQWWYGGGWISNKLSAKPMAEEEAKQLLELMFKDKRLRLHIGGYKDPAIKRAEK